MYSNLFLPPFPHLESGHNASTYLTVFVVTVLLSQAGLLFIAPQLLQENGLCALHQSWLSYALGSGSLINKRQHQEVAWSRDVLIQ